VAVINNGGGIEISMKIKLKMKAQCNQWRNNRNQRIWRRLSAESNKCSWQYRPGRNIIQYQPLAVCGVSAISIL
jgi:hypothetical protein